MERNAIRFPFPLPLRTMGEYKANVKHYFFAFISPECLAGRGPRHREF
jgi:hypothetical protein